MATVEAPGHLGRIGAEVPRFFFDIEDGNHARDTEGMTCRNVDHARAVAKRLLPEIAIDELPKSSAEIITYVVAVRDEADTVIYTARLDFRGEEPKPSLEFG